MTMTSWFCRFSVATQFSTSTRILESDRSGRLSMATDLPGWVMKPPPPGMRFGQAAGHVVGARIEITGQLGHFGERPAEGFLRVGVVPAVQTISLC
jgi:hypothetical protein